MARTGAVSGNIHNIQLQVKGGTSLSGVNNLAQAVANLGGIISPQNHQMIQSGLVALGFNVNVKSFTAETAAIQGQTAQSAQGGTVFSCDAATNNIQITGQRVSVANPAPGASTTRVLDLRTPITLRADNNVAIEAAVDGMVNAVRAMNNNIPAGAVFVQLSAAENKFTVAAAADVTNLAMLAFAAVMSGNIDGFVAAITGGRVEAGTGAAVAQDSFDRAVKGSPESAANPMFTVEENGQNVAVSDTAKLDATNISGQGLTLTDGMSKAIKQVNTKTIREAAKANIQAQEKLDKAVSLLAQVIARAALYDKAGIKMDAASRGAINNAIKAVQSSKDKDVRESAVQAIAESINSLFAGKTQGMDFRQIAAGIGLSVNVDLAGAINEKLRQLAAQQLAPASPARQQEQASVIPAGKEAKIETVVTETDVLAGAEDLRAAAMATALSYQDIINAVNQAKEAGTRLKVQNENVVTLVSGAQFIANVNAAVSQMALNAKNGGTVTIAAASAEQRTEIMGILAGNGLGNVQVVLANELNRENIIQLARAQGEIRIRGVVNVNEGAATIEAFEKVVDSLVYADENFNMVMAKFIDRIARSYTALGFTAGAMDRLRQESAAAGKSGGAVISVEGAAGNQTGDAMNEDLVSAFESEVAF
jgi:hypothetical protein